jgi:uncharacterized protein with HEPN domain
MKHSERVEDYLQLVQAIDRATSYLEPVSSMEAFEENPQVQDAVIRNWRLPASQNSVPKA